MKRLSFCLVAGLGLLLTTGCGQAKRRIEDTGRGIIEHGVEKVQGKAADVGQGAVDSADKKMDEQKAAKDAKADKDRNALKGDDDKDKDE